MYVVHDGEEAVFGRSSRCGPTRLPLSDTGIARRQFLVRVRSGRVQLRDLGGTNPTWVNDHPYREAEIVVVAPDKNDNPSSVELRTGDRITVATTMLTVEIVEHWEPNSALGVSVPLSPREWPERVLAFPVARPSFGNLRLLPTEGLPRIEGYVLVRRLGRGSGTTFLARADKDHRNVVLKVLRTPVSLDEVELAGLGDRLDALCQAATPSLLSVRSYGLAAAVPAGTRVGLEIDWWDGIDLRTWIQHRSRPLTNYEIHSLVEAATDNLQIAHAAGIRHLGLSPENVLIRSEAGELEVRLTDFQVRFLATTTLPGWSCSQAVAERNEGFQTERRRLHPTLADASDDVWSLAAVIHWILHGIPPSAPRLSSRSNSPLSGNPKGGSSKSHGLATRPSRPLEKVIDRALAGEFLTAAGLRVALDALPKPNRLRIG